MYAPIINIFNIEGDEFDKPIAFSSSGEKVMDIVVCDHAWPPKIEQIAIVTSRRRRKFMAEIASYLD